MDRGTVRSRPSVSTRNRLDPARHLASWIAVGLLPGGAIHIKETCFFAVVVVLWAATVHSDRRKTLIGVVTGWLAATVLIVASRALSGGLLPTWDVLRLKATMFAGPGQQLATRLWSIGVALGPLSLALWFGAPALAIISAILGWRNGGLWRFAVVVAHRDGAL